MSTVSGGQTQTLLKKKESFLEMSECESTLQNEKMSMPKIQSSEQSKHLSSA